MFHKLQILLQCEIMLGTFNIVMTKKHTMNFYIGLVILKIVQFFNVII
jgi:hypothetical protein